jgi:hypothetical protein
MDQDLTPKWDIKPAKEKIIPNDSDFGGQIGGIGSPTVASVKTTQNNVINNTSSINILGWTSNLEFSSIDYNTVAWSAGSIILKDGTTYSISGSNTGNISAVTYIYFDGNVSTTTLQTTTTASSSVGTNKILIAVAQNNTDTTSEASFQVFGGAGGFMITRSGIAANTITANEIAANTITSNQLTATAIDAMTVTGALIRTAASGKRVELNGPSNSFDAYDASGLFLTLGTSAGAALKITPTATTQTDGIFVDSAYGCVGFRYTNSTNVANIGVYLTLDSTGANNNLEAIKIIKKGSGYGIYNEFYGTTVGIGLFNKGTGNSIYIVQDSGASGDAINLINDSTGDDISLSHSSSTGSALDINYGGNQNAIDIYNTGDSSSIYMSNTATNTLVPAYYSTKAGAGKHMILHSSCNSATNSTGIEFDINNAGAGLEYAMAFSGSEYVSAAVSGTQDKKIRVNVGGTTYYIPCYTG